MSEQLKAGLITLHLDDFYDLTTTATSVVQVLRQAAYVIRDQPTEWAILTRLAVTIEAQVKPARIPEPGLWGVVEAGSARVKYVRWPNGSWRDGGNSFRWDDLIDPTLICEGAN